MVRELGKDFISKSFVIPIQANMSTIRKVATVFFNGLTVIFTKAISSTI